MFRMVGALFAAIAIAVFAPSASASHARTGVLDEPRGHLIIDFFDSEKDSFGFTGMWEEWTPPEGVTYAVFELFGGAGESGEGHGHVAAGIDLEPGETYRFRVGGGGEDTSAFSTRCAIPEWWECGGTVIAAGGDSATSWNQTNLVPSDASPAIENWEGGGPDSQVGPGWAIIHYWLEEDDAPTGEKAPPTGDLRGPIGNADPSAQAVPTPGVVPNHCKVRRKGRRASLWIVSGRVGLGHGRAVRPRQDRACMRTPR